MNSLIFKCISFLIVVAIVITSYREINKQSICGEGSYHICSPIGDGDLIACGCAVNTTKSKLSCPDGYREDWFYTHPSYMRTLENKGCYISGHIGLNVTCNLIGTDEIRKYSNDPSPLAHFSYQCHWSSKDNDSFISWEYTRTEYPEYLIDSKGKSRLCVCSIDNFDSQEFCHNNLKNFPGAENGA
jgi:hypothetical protein